MVRAADDLPSDPAVVVLNPDDEVTAVPLLGGWMGAKGASRSIPE